MIGIVCGSAAAALLIAGAAVFLIPRNSKVKQVPACSSAGHNSQSSEREKQIEYIDHDKLGKLALNDDDQWI